MSDRAHLTFALALHDVIAADRRSNACWSPYSVASALGLAAQAAAGKTRAELVDVLGEVDVDLLRAAVITEDAEFAVANTLWVWDELPVNPDFLTGLARWPGGTVRSAPFAEDTEGARKLINADVAETTRDLIPELLPPGAINPDTVAAIVNAIYLKTAWLSEFPAADTQQLPFHAPQGVVDVSTMRRDANLRYAAAGGWQAVALPAHAGVEAVVLLPDGELADLSADQLDGVLGGLDFTQIELFLPKLDVTVSSPLKDVLTRLGVRSLFTYDADLTGLSPDPRLFVDDVLHEAVLRIDEQGLEGAAATAITFRTTSFEMPAEPLTVRVDRPYLLLVRHASSGAVYFLAQVVDPS